MSLSHRTFTAGILAVLIAYTACGDGTAIRMGHPQLTFDELVEATSGELTSLTREMAQDHLALLTAGRKAAAAFTAQEETLWALIAACDRAYKKEKVAVLAADLSSLAGKPARPAPTIDVQSPTTTAKDRLRRIAGEQQSILAALAENYDSQFRAIHDKLDEFALVLRTVRTQHDQQLLDAHGCTAVLEALREKIVDERANATYIADELESRHELISGKIAALYASIELGLAKLSQSPSHTTESLARLDKLVGMLRAEREPEDQLAKIAGDLEAVGEPKIDLATQSDAQLASMVSQVDDAEEFQMLASLARRPLAPAPRAVPHAQTAPLPRRDTVSLQNMLVPADPGEEGYKGAGITFVAQAEVMSEADMTSGPEADASAPVFYGDPLAEPVDIDFRDMELSTIVTILAQKAQINVVAGAEVSGTVSAKLTNVPLMRAMETVLRRNGLGIIEIDGIYEIVRYEEAVAAKRDQRMVYLQNAQADEVKKTLEDTLIGDPDATHIGISANKSTNVVIISGPEKAVQKLEDMVMKLDIAEPQLPTISSVVKLNYSEPNDVQQVITPFLSPDIGKVSIDARSRHILITDLPIVVDQIETIIREIDMPVKQVSIETMIVDAVMNDRAETGVDWLMNAIRRTNRRGQVVGDLQALGMETDITGGNQTAGRSEAIPLAANLVFNVLTSDIDIKGVLAAEVQSDNAQILASPVIVTAENQQSSVSIAQEIPYQELTQSTTGPPISSTEFKDVGTILRVTPKVTHDGHVQVTLYVNQSDTKGESVTGVPPEDKRELTTTLLARDGQTIFIGGLRRFDDEQSIRRTPILGDIPVLNFLFRDNNVVRDFVELVVFLTCNILPDNIPDLTPSEQRTYDRLGSHPEVNGQREMFRSILHPEQERDPFWKWRREK